MPDESSRTPQPETRLWDEITKAIVFTMTPHLLPVIREAYGKEYPPGTPLTLLSTEQSTYLDNPSTTLSSRLMDIALLVDGTDYYHIECQMENDYQMVIRMIAYDLHFSIQHCAAENAGTGEITLHLPQSFVIYPAKNRKIPDKLQCRLVFPDGNQHIYQIPTVRIQTYSLEDIHEKHLNFFVPFTILRFQSLLDNQKKTLTKEALTAFVERLIVDLKEEVEAGILTETELSDYINLLEMASKHVFRKYPEYHEEVLKMTEPMIKLPSVQIRELQQTIAQDRAAIAQAEAAIAQAQTTIAQAQTTIAQKDAYIAELEQKLAMADL